MAADDSIIDSKQSGFVMDRGFYSKDNLQYLVKGGYRFIIALPMSLKYCQKLMEEHGQAYLYRQLKGYMQKERIPLKKVLLELDKMKTIQYPGQQKPRLLNPPTKTQRMIFELLEIPVPGCIG